MTSQLKMQTTMLILHPTIRWTFYWARTPWIGWDEQKVVRP